MSEVESYLDNFVSVPSHQKLFPSAKDHPDFPKLIGLHSRLNQDDPKLYKELNTVMKDMLYDDVSDVYRKYSDLYFTGNHN